MLFVVGLAIGVWITSMVAYIVMKEREAAVRMKTADECVRAFREYANNVERMTDILESRRNRAVI